MGESSVGMWLTINKQLHSFLEMYSDMEGFEYAIKFCLFVGDMVRKLLGDLSVSVIRGDSIVSNR